MTHNPESPFWQEGPSLYNQPQTLTLWPWWLLFHVIRGGVVFLVLFLFSRPLAFAWLGYSLLLVGFFVHLVRKQSLQRNITRDLQARAQELTGASLIDSATHVAGHPELGRDEKVVLAMVGPELHLYRFTSSALVDVIPLGELVAVSTVVYDDERVPHIEVVDSTAQALQLTFQRKGNPYTCLFNHMRKFRPIDWYHAIQQAKYKSNESLL